MQLTDQWVRGFVPEGIKRPERECEHSPPPIIKVKNKGIYTFISPYALIGCIETTFLCNKPNSLVFTFFRAHAFLTKCNSLHCTPFYAITFACSSLPQWTQQDFCPVMPTPPPHKRPLRYNINQHR
jgi:hypothetical protein